MHIWRTNTSRGAHILSLGSFDVTLMQMLLAHSLKMLKELLFLYLNELVKDRNRHVHLTSTPHPPSPHITSPETTPR